MDPRNILPGFCTCPAFMVSAYYFQIHTGCIHSQTYDDVTQEDLISHPHIHNPQPQHSVHVGTTSGGGPVHQLRYHPPNHSHGGDTHLHHHHHHHHHHLQHHLHHQQNSIGTVGCEDKDKDNSNKQHNMMSLLSFHNSTLHCDKVHGESYWVSFHEKSFYRGQHFKLYKGIINGIGPQSGLKCVVKVFANTHGTKELCTVETYKSEKFRELVRAFNKRLGRDSPHYMRATRSYWAPIDEVSKLKQLFFSGDKKLHIGEAVLFEQDVRVSDYSTKKSKVNTFVDQNGKTYDTADYSSVVNAFVHFSHHHSNGNLVVCGLNGIKDDLGFFFSTPIIHSRNSSYGDMDRGERGIMDVLRNHTCGQMCKQLFEKTNLDILTAPTKTPVNVTSPSIDIGRNTQRQRQSVDQTDGSCVFSVTDSPNAKNSSAIMATSPCSVNSLTSWDGSADPFDNKQFLEPSAPEMEVGNMSDLPPPPPYTPVQEARVALWIIGEESPNAFLNLSPSAILPCGSVTLGSSIECHSSHTATTGHVNSCSVDLESNCTAGVRRGSSATDTTTPTTADMNANFSFYSSANNSDQNNNNNATSSVNTECPDLAPSTAHCNTRNNDTATAIIELANGSCKQTRKQVRFDLEPPIATNHSMCDDVTMESWTNPTASVSSSPTLPVRSRSHHINSQCSVDSNTENNNNINNDTVNNNIIPNNNQAPSLSGVSDINTETTIPTDLPPPYDEQDVATANWLLSGRGGLDMYNYRPPVIIQTSRSDNGVIIRTAHSLNYNNNDNNNNDTNNNTNNDDVRNSAGSFFIALSPSEINPCHGRFF